MVTHDRQDMDSSIWKSTFFPLVNAHPFNRTRVNIMPLFAGDHAGIAANAATLINKKPKL